MALIVVGGHSRNVGKTSVVAGLIAALPEFEWMAAKITQYGHGICSANGKVCHCATSEHSWAISEERDRSGESDTSRFLVAGAAKVLWVRTEQGRLGQAMPALQAKIAGSRNVILESNSVLEFVRPDLYLTVLDPAISDFKNSARQFLDSADAVILQGEIQSASTWQASSLHSATKQAIFRISPPPYVTPEIIDFVKTALTKSTCTR
ncbi:MAG TPA: hypothetical protein VI386_38940 [Candidatus Sulfotelmatobacter sp.]